MKTQPSRRDFLKSSGFAAAAGTIVTVSATHADQTAGGPKALFNLGLASYTPTQVYTGANPRNGKAGRPELHVAEGYALAADRFGRRHSGRDGQNP